MQTDPVGYKDQMNLYAYVGNDPLNKTDPSGKFTLGDVWRAAKEIFTAKAKDTVKEKVEDTGKEVVKDGAKDLGATPAQICQGEHCATAGAQMNTCMLKNCEKEILGAGPSKPTDGKPTEPSQEERVKTKLEEHDKKFRQEMDQIIRERDARSSSSSSPSGEGTLIPLN